MKRAALLVLLAACSRPAPPAEEPEMREAPVAARPGAKGSCTADEDCRATGCSGTLCAAEDVISTCEVLPEHACYREPTTTCGCSAGRCAWEPSEALRDCLRKAAAK